MQIRLVPYGVGRIFFSPTALAQFLSEKTVLVRKNFFYTTDDE